MKKTLTTLIFILAIHTSYAQLNPQDKLGTWFDIGGNHRISEKISINTYTQIWLYEVNDNFNFLLLKTGLSYHVNPKLTATLSYGYSDYDGDINVSAPHTFENRISEQITYKHKISKIPLDHRFRIEHRFRRKLNSNTKIARLRYRLGTKLKLNKTLFIRLNNEVILTPKISNSPENRFYTGLGVNISTSKNIQIGYLNRNTSKGANLHRLQIAFFFKTDLRKKTN